MDFVYAGLFGLIAALVLAAYLKATSSNSLIVYGLAGIVGGVVGRLLINLIISILGTIIGAIIVGALGGIAFALIARAMKLAR
jgi:uncharacterized membrane protein YjjB (DUF3815 family)